MSDTPSRPKQEWKRKRLLMVAGMAMVVAAALAASPIAAAAAPATATPTMASSGAASVVRSCAAPAPGQAACLALRRTNVTEPAPIQRIAATPGTVAPSSTPSGYGPSDLASAYKFSTAGGAGQTVAIVDAYNNPHAGTDLSTYRAQYGLPACNQSNGCFTIVNQTGGSTLPPNDAGWAGEIDVDTEMVSAVCPNCKILLVEASTANFTDLATAENYAAAHAKFVSNSYGASEWSSETSLDSSYNHPGVAITVSSGDNGNSVLYPAASQYVTAVGGTSLYKASNSRGWTETAWNGAGSGCSAYETRPSWVSFSITTTCGRRSTADVSADADPNTGVAIYQSYGLSGWQIYGGTSVASPIVASLWALAGPPNASDHAAQYPWYHMSSLFDVTSGSNGGCGQLCTAGPGYDGPTGLGTPDGTTAFTSGGTPPPPCPGFSWRATQVFTAGMVFANCKGRLQMQADGNFVLYNQNGTALWSTISAGHPGDETVFQADGNLVVYTASGQAIWSSKTNGRAAGGLFAYQADGNLVIYNAALQPVYASNTARP